MEGLEVLTPYRQLGGDEALRALVDRFYDIMHSEPGVELVRDMHDGDTPEIRNRLYDFLSGWLGGPERYAAKYGHPRLRASHEFFSIGDAERDQWMYCMSKALAETPMSDSLRERLETAFAKTADFLRNRREAPTPLPDK